MWTSSRPPHPTWATWSGWRTATAEPDARPARLAFLGLGANLGNREATLRSALARIAQLGAIESVSSVYETEPVGHTDQPVFWNLALGLRTQLEPAELLDALHAIEDDLGRVRTFRNAPRTLDIDILLYDDAVVNQPGLTIPHPRMHERAFVLVPLAEIGGASVPSEMDVHGVRRLFEGEMLL